VQSEGNNYLFELRFQFPADPYYLKVVRSIIQAAGQKSNLSLETIRNIQIVISELISNIIIHTYQKDPRQVIILKITEEEEKISCFLRDFGPRVELSSFKSRDLSDYREDGLGLFLVNNLSNYIHYNRTIPLGTEVEVSFNKEIIGA
jgi:serine/threonine-protein kinase RsbW